MKSVICCPAFLDLALNSFEEVRAAFLEVWVAEDTFGMFLAGLVESVHVELPDETVHLVVAEELGQHHFLEFTNVLDDELSA